MKITVLIFLFFSVPVCVLGQHWSMLKTYPIDSNFIFHSSTDNDNIILTGSVRGNISFDGTSIQSSLASRNGLVVKLNTLGSLIWYKLFKSSSDFHILCSQIDNNSNIILQGFFSDYIIIDNDTIQSKGGNDGVIIKLDSIGNLIWYNHYGTSHNDYVSSNIWWHGNLKCLALDDIDDIYLSVIYGLYQGGNDTLWIENQYVVSNGYSDVAICKLNKGGDVQWITNSGGSQADGGGNISYFKGSIIYCGGVGSSTSYFSNLTLSNVDYTTTTYVANLDTMGLFNWVKGGGYTNTYGGLGFQCIATDYQSNVYGVGTFSADQIRFDNLVLNQFINDDIFVIKYDKDGNVKWLRKGGYFGGQNNGTLITVDKDYRVWVFGKASSTCTFGNGGDTLFTNGTSIFVWQCDTLGNEEQFYSVGLSSYAPSGISQSPNGDILLSGYAQNTTLTFGSLTANVGNQPTLYLARLSQGWPTVIPVIEGKAGEVMVFPNPATQQVNVALQAYKGYTRVFVYDMQGRQVYGVSTQKQQAQFSVIAWPRGMYIVKVTQGEQVITKTLMVE